MRKDPRARLWPLSATARRNAHCTPTRPFKRLFASAPAESIAARYHFEHFGELRALFTVALETGLWKGDLPALRWSSVNLRDGWLRVSMGKTKEEALVPMSRLCREALEECKARDVVSPEFVFVDDKGKRLPEVRVLRAFATAKKVAGITRRSGSTTSGTRSRRRSPVRASRFR